MTRVGVVGAGISGLATVRALAASDVDVVCFEAADEPGGLVRSRMVDGRVLELGPQRLRLSPQIETLLADLGLADQVRFGTSDVPLYVYVDDTLRVAPLSVGQAITTDLLSWRGKLRMLAEPVTGGPPRPGESVEDYLSRAFGREAATRFMGPIYSGLYGTDPAEMPVEHSLGRALETFGVDGSILLWVCRRLLRRGETPPIVTLEDGLGAIPQAIYDAHTDRIRLTCPVDRIVPESGGFHLETAAGSEVVDEVVVTTPAETAATLLEPVNPGYARLADLAYNPIATVHLESGFDGEGVGAIVPDEENVAISGCTWNASLLDRDRVFTCYLDPGSYPGLVDATEEELGRAAAEAFETMTGASASPLYVHRWVPGMPAYDHSWASLPDVPSVEGVHLCANYVDRPGLPGRLRQANAVASSISA